MKEPIYNFQDPAYYKVREDSITGWMFGFDPTNPGESIPSIAGEFFIFYISYLKNHGEFITSIACEHLVRQKL